MKNSKVWEKAAYWDWEKVLSFSKISECFKCHNFRHFQYQFSKWTKIQITSKMDKEELLLITFVMRIILFLKTTVWNIYLFYLWFIFEVYLTK